MKENRKDGRKSDTHVATKHIAGVRCDVSSQPEVADLRHPTVRQQNISGSKIPVNTLHTDTHNYTEM